MECPICQEERNLKDFGCGHGVCAQCYPKMQVEDMERRCPLCRCLEVLPVEMYRKKIADLTRENDEYQRRIDKKSVNENMYLLLDQEYQEMTEKYKQQHTRIRSLEYDLNAAREELKRVKKVKKQAI